MPQAPIYMFAYESASGYYKFVKSEDGGSTFTNLTTGLRAPASPSYWECSINKSKSNSDIWWCSDVPCANAYIGKYVQGEASSSFVDVRPIIPFKNCYTHIGPIFPYDENYSFFTYDDTYYHWTDLYRFNNNLAAPAVAYLGRMVSSQRPRGLYVISPTDIYIGFGQAWGGSQPCVWHYNGSSLSSVPYFKGGDKYHCFGIQYYNGEIYVLTCNTLGGNTVLSKGTVAGGWATVNTWADGPMSPTMFSCDGRLYVNPDNGHIGVHTSSFDLYYYNGSSWSIIAAPLAPGSGYTNSLHGLASGNFITAYDSGGIWRLITFDGPAGTSAASTVTGYVAYKSPLLYDTSPYLASAPLTPNNKYFTSQPMVWSIGD